jgi:hypothetical protein
MDTINDLHWVLDRYKGPGGQRAPLTRILTIYLQHFNAARPHRALGKLAPVQVETQPPQAAGINLTDHQIRRRMILGELTSECQPQHDRTGNP